MNSYTNNDIIILIFVRTSLDILILVQVPFVQDLFNDI